MSFHFCLTDKSISKTEPNSQRWFRSKSTVGRMKAQHRTACTMSDCLSCEACLSQKTQLEQLVFYNTAAEEYVKTSTRKQRKIKGEINSTCGEVTVALWGSGSSTPDQ